jgi:uncharacterized membrane protein YcaP (DUF421 family)
MKKEEIHLWDIKRILFGQAPPEFLLEVFIRSLIIYVAAIIVMRWMGKRMNGQLTIIEMAVMVTMGAILAVPMQVPDRGLLQGFFVLFCILLLLRGINWWAYKNSRFEKLVQGEVSTLVKDGIIDLAELKRTSISKQQLFEILRAKKIFHLGKVKRVYLEACGIFSVYPQEKAKPGLPLYPPTDPGVLDSQNYPDEKLHACCNCGSLASDINLHCHHCGSDQWTKAIL